MCNKAKRSKSTKCLRIVSSNCSGYWCLSTGRIISLPHGRPRNDLTQQDTAAAEEKSGIRWTVEQFHREDKQITGLECCQCRLGRSQRNHIALAGLTWLRFKQLAYEGKKTVYQLKQGLLDLYMRQELAKPSLVFA